MRVTLGSLCRIYRTFSLLLALSTLVNYDFQGHLQPCKDEGIKTKLLLLECLADYLLGAQEKKHIPSRLLQVYKGNSVPLPQIYLLCKIYLRKKKIQR